MRDNTFRRVIKASMRWVYACNQALNRALVTHVLRAPPRHQLTGSCEGCGRCCEAPSISVGRLIAGMPWLRRGFLWWQAHINGFELTRFERAHRVFVFTCTHYDAVTRACDSYDSRPGICRDYPVSLLDQDAPQLFEECSYTLSLVGAHGLAKAIDDDPTLTPEQRDRLKRGLFLK